MYDLTEFMFIAAPVRLVSLSSTGSEHEYDLSPGVRNPIYVPSVRHGSRQGEPHLPSTIALAECWNY